MKDPNPPFPGVAAPDVRAGDVRLAAAAFWYFSGLLFALALSLGFSFLTPGPVAHSPRGDVIDALAIHDGRWYKQIAAEGYSYDPNSRSNVAFFPLYPLLGRAVAAALPVRMETALLIVSNTSFFLALIVLGLYVRARYRDADANVVDFVLLSACLFPTACFFRLPYSESTFLLLTVVAMHGIQRRWPTIVVALVVGLATASRPVGVALLAPLALDLWRRHAGLGRRLWRLAVWLPLACWGLAGYMAYQHFAFGDALAFAKTQQHWGVRTAPDLPEHFLALLTLEPIAAVYDHESPAFWARADAHGLPWLSLQFANPLFFLATLALVVAEFARILAGRRVRAAIAHVESATAPLRRVPLLDRFEISLSLLLLAIPYFTRGYEMGMASMGRFVAVAFPIYLAFGRWLALLPPAVAAALLALSAFLMAAYSALFAAGYLIF